MREKGEEREGEEGGREGKGEGRVEGILLCNEAERWNHNRQ